MSISLAALPLWVAVVPLGLYLAVLGWLHLRRRPTVFGGGLDLILLATAVSGLVLAGPLALLQPAFGAATWATGMLLSTFVLIVASAILVTRPRLVIYNITVEQLRPILAELATGLDPSARWAGESVALPVRGLQVLVDGHGLARSVSLVAVGKRTSAEAWAEFGRRLRQAVGALRVRRNLWGVALASLGCGIVLGALGWATLVSPRSSGPAAVARTSRAT
jgi:hypothetical protein